MRLSEKDDKTTVSYEKLTDLERTALKGLAEHARKKKWAVDGAGIVQTMDGFALPAGDAGTFTLDAEITKVQKILSKALKPERRIVSVVYREGAMEEVIEAETKKGEIVTTKGSRPKKGAKGTSVGAPTRGCPEPDFVKAEIRATRVLREFLDSEQLEDFEKFNRFVTVGASGCKYMITSRHARDELAKYHRSLYDLRMDIPICAHDYEIPAAEEMLTFHVLMQLPEWEKFVRQKPNEIEGH